MHDDDVHSCPYWIRVLLRMAWHAVITLFFASIVIGLVVGAHLFLTTLARQLVLELPLTYFLGIFLAAGYPFLLLWTATGSIAKEEEGRTAHKKLKKILDEAPFLDSVEPYPHHDEPH